MIFLCSLVSIVTILYFLMNGKNSKKELLGMMTFIIVATVWSVAILFAKYELNLLASLALLVGYVLLAYYFFFFIKEEHHEVLATQQSYWNVPASKIRNKFVCVEDEKEDRIEVKHESNHFYVKNENACKYLSHAFWDNFKYFNENYHVTQIHSLNELQDYVIFDVIFESLQERIKEQEVEIDFNEVLGENDHIVEYFLMHLWERYMKKENIGIAQLEAVVSSEFEREFINALDNLLLDNVKLSGSYLFYQYSEFKKDKHG